MFYFAMVTAVDTTFDQSFKRNDYQVLTYELEQQEGEFASMSIVVKNPRTPLLGGPLWMWFSVSPMAGGPAVPQFFGRLVGIPQSVLEERVTLEFSAQPIDLNAQKAAVAAALRVLPHFDLIFVSEENRLDSDVVLEAYPRAWHFNRVTHAVGTSDVLIGGDAVLTLYEEDLLYLGFSFDLGESPVTAVSVEAAFQWTQIASGQVDLTKHIYDNWPNEEPQPPNVITSFTIKEEDWPKPLANLNRGWSVASASALPVYPLAILSKSSSLTLKIDWGKLGGGGTSTTTETSNDQYVREQPPGSIDLSPIFTESSFNVQYDGGDPVNGDPPSPVSTTASSTWSDGFIPLHYTTVSLVAGYNTERQRKEIVRFTLVADIQPIVNMPGEDEAHKISLNSVSLNEKIDAGDVEPIGDVRRRSYVTLPRGEQSLQFLIAMARAKLIRSSRVARLTHHLTRDAALEKLSQITLTRNASLFDPRLPLGEALGKIVAYRVACDGKSGRFECSITSACAIGRGGEIEIVGGTPRYVASGYVEDGYQDTEGGTVQFDSSVGYTPPLFEPTANDLDFTLQLTAAQVLEETLTVQNHPWQQRIALEEVVDQGWGSETIGGWAEGEQEARIEARTSTLEQLLEEKPTAARFKLFDVKAGITTEINLVVTDLKIPAMIDLEGGS